MSTGSRLSRRRFSSVWLARALSSELFGVHPLDPLTLSATVLGLVAIGLAAAAGPIIRAVRIDPVRSLRMP